MLALGIAAIPGRRPVVAEPPVRLWGRGHYGLDALIVQPAHLLYAIAFEDAELAHWHHLPP